MSGVTKAVGKVFKSVGKTLKWVVPAVLAAGAIVFTAGAAIPAIGALVGTGGWGAAASSLTGLLGLSTETTLGSIVAGAITQAGTGAALGAFTSAITGGKIVGGLELGAAAGAITGGVMGAVNGPIMPPGKATTADLSGAKAPITGVTTSPIADVAGVPKAAAAENFQAPMVAPSTAGVQAGTGRGLLGSLWDEAKHSEFAGGAIRGLGEGLIAKSNADEELRALSERDRRTSDNYKVGTAPRGLLPQGYGPGANPGLTAKSIDAPRAQPAIPAPNYTQNTRETTSEYRYVYDPTQRQLVKVPVTRAA